MKGVLYIFFTFIFRMLPVYTEDVISCPSTGTAFLPHPASCSKFVICDEGAISIAPCPDGYYFNSMFGICDIPIAKGCHLDEIESEENIPDVENDNNDIPDNESSAEENVEEESDLVNCPSTGIAFLPHPTSCSKFVICDEGEITVVQCPDDYYFNSIKSICDIPIAYGCHLDDKADSEENTDDAEDDENIIPEDDLSAEEGGQEDSSAEEDGQEDSSAEEDGQEDSGLLECPKQGTHFFQHPSSCSRFIKCNEGLYRVVDCIEGYYFESKLGWCEPASSVNCTIEEDEDLGLECPSTGRYFLPHPRSCSKFVKCNEGLYRVVNCVEGQHFDPTFGWCDISSNVDCTIDDETQNDEDLEMAFDCTGSTQSFYPHPRICSQFVECNFGVSRVHECIHGLHFNPEAGHCDFPSNANCE